MIRMIRTWLRNREKREADEFWREWEREGYLQDIAFAEKWLVSGDPVMVERGTVLKAWATEQLATC